MKIKHSDALTSKGIYKYLDNSDFFNLQVHESVGSTNKLMKQYAKNEEGFVIAANEQTDGIGRMNRHFFSPKNSGIYFSVLLKPDILAEDTIFITTMAAVAVCKAIGVLSEQKPKIKWVNDIFIGNKKVCGILTQGSFNSNNKADHIILGIGLNVYVPDEGFDSQIKDIADSVLTQKQDDFKNQILAQILDQFYSLYKDFNKQTIHQLYKSYSLVIGKTVFIHSAEGVEEVEVLDINEQCNLIVKTKSGEVQTLFSGEISIRFN